VSASTVRAIAITALAVAGVALATCVWFWLLLRRVRSAQRILLGGGKQDLVDFAVSLQARIDDLLRAVDEVAAGLSRVDKRVDARQKTAIAASRTVDVFCIDASTRSPVRAGTNRRRWRCSTRRAPASSSRRSKAATTRGST